MATQCAPSARTRVGSHEYLGSHQRQYNPGQGIRGLGVGVDIILPGGTRYIHTHAVQIDFVNTFLSFTWRSR
jgi:hypothetical protein